MIDLESIFGDSPGPIVGMVPAPQAGDNGRALEEMAGSPTPGAMPPEPAPAGQMTLFPESPKPDGETNLGGDAFHGWILRPDVDGRMGWEPPDLPEERRWWARARFEDLPTLAAYFPGSRDNPVSSNPKTPAKPGENAVKHGLPEPRASGSFGRPGCFHS